MYVQKRTQIKSERSVCIGAVFTVLPSSLIQYMWGDFGKVVVSLSELGRVLVSLLSQILKPWVWPEVYREGQELKGSWPSFWDIAWSWQEDMAVNENEVYFTFRNRSLSLLLPIVLFCIVTFIFVLWGMLNFPFERKMRHKWTTTEIHGSFNSLGRVWLCPGMHLITW